MGNIVKLVSDRHYRVLLNGMGQVHFKPGIPKDVKAECVSTLLVKAPFIKIAPDTVAIKTPDSNPVAVTTVTDEVHGDIELDVIAEINTTPDEGVESNMVITDESFSDGADDDTDDTYATTPDSVSTNPSGNKKGRRRKRS